jgi:hypothetical protein
MGSNALIIADLSLCLLEGDREFELLNTYKGVPFRCKAQLKDIVEDVAVFSTQKAGTVNLEQETRTILLSDGFFDPIEAQVQSFDILTSRIRLTDLQYASVKFGNRREARVEPEILLEIEVEFKGERFSGQMADISMGGIGIYLPGGMEDSPIRAGSTLNLTIQIPGGKVGLPGRIRRIQDFGEDRHRLAVQFTGSSPEKALIVRYIFRRREQIRAEAKKIFEARYQSKLAES